MEGIYSRDHLLWCFHTTGTILLISWFEDFRVAAVSSIYLSEAFFNGKQKHCKLANIIAWSINWPVQYSVQDIDDAIFFVSFVRLRWDFETFVFLARLISKEIFDNGKNA